MKTTDLFFYPSTIYISKNPSKELRRKGIVEIGKLSKRLTVAGIIKDDCIHVGIASCSYSDVFTKKEGRKVALNKATENPVLVLPIADKSKTSKQFVEGVKKFLNSGLFKYGHN